MYQRTERIGMEQNEIINGTKKESDIYFHSKLMLQKFKMESIRLHSVLI